MAITHQRQITFRAAKEWLYMISSFPAHQMLHSWNCTGQGFFTSGTFQFAHLQVRTVLQIWLGWCKGCVDSAELPMDPALASTDKFGHAAWGYEPIGLPPFFSQDALEHARHLEEARPGVAATGKRLSNSTL